MGNGKGKLSATPLGYKQKSGPLQKAGYDKDATTPFRLEEPKKPKIDLEAIRKKAQQLQTQKTADSTRAIEDFKLPDIHGVSREQYIESGQEHILKKLDKEAGKKYAKQVYDFSIIKPTEEFPHTGVSWEGSNYTRAGYDIGSGERAGGGSGQLPSQVAKKRVSGYEQDRAKKISEYASKVK